VWNDGYSLGIAELDKQHRGLLEFFPCIERQIARGGSWNDIHLTIVELRNLAQTHFHFEEAMMRLFGYPDAGSHEAAHCHFFARLQEIEQQSLTAVAEQGLIEVLRGWLIAHILEADRALADYILAGPQVICSADRRSALPFLPQS
jgi:hemerythrin